MATLIQEYLTDMDDKFTGINTEVINKNSKYTRINVFNEKDDDIYQKIWILTPKIKIYSVVNSNLDKFNYNLPLKLILFNNTPEHKKLILFIKRLERKINIDLKKENQNIKNKSSLENKEKYQVLSTVMPHNNGELNFHIYNSNNMRINLNEVKSKLDCRLYLELRDIYIDDNNFVGYNWSVLQMKVYHGFDFSKCLFDDVCDNTPDRYNECYHCLYCPNQHVRTSIISTQQIIPPPPPPPKLASILPSILPSILDKKPDTPNNLNQQPVKTLYITVNDLLNMKDKLKSTSNIKKELDLKELPESKLTRVKSQLKDLD